MLPLLQAAAAAAHPLDDTAARWLWAVPLLPLAGFVINGALSILPAYHAGAADPGLAHGDGHGAAHRETEAPDTAGAHADDHHPVKRHRYAGLVSIIGPGVLMVSFLLSAMIFFAMRGAGGGAMTEPFIQRYFS